MMATIKDNVIERLVERVWTLAGCVASLRGKQRSEILARLIYPDGSFFEEGTPDRESLYRWPDELSSFAENLECTIIRLG